MASENNLVTCHPQVKKWWDYDKNAPAFPEEYTLFSPKRAYFKCPDCGTETYRRICDAFFQADTHDKPILFNCPYCAGKRPIKGSTSLAALYPEIAAECISDVDTDNILPTALSRLQWKCKDCGGEWFSLVTYRVNGLGCPYCEGRPINQRANPGVDSLDVVNPALAAEWSPENDLSPHKVLATSSYIVAWRCPTCHGDYKARIRDRKVGDDSCPYCEGRRVKPGFNSLDVVNPELAAEWSPVNEMSPREALATSSRTVVWRCPTCHGDYNARIKDREVSDDSCPYCKEIKPLPGYNTFATKHPQLIKQEWAFNENMLIGADPDKILDTNVQKAWWKCPSCQHLYLMSAKDRLMKEKRRHNPCTFCGGRRLPSPRVVL